MRIHRKYVTAFFSPLKSVWKEHSVILEKEGLNLVRKMIILNYKLLWVSTIVTIKSTRCTKKVGFLMALQIGQEATSDQQNLIIGDHHCLLKNMLCNRPSTETQGFHSREEGQNLCPQIAYILIGWHEQ